MIKSMKNEPERFPPFVIAYEKEGHLKISKTSLKNALDELTKKLEQIDEYEVDSSTISY